MATQPYGINGPCGDLPKTVHSIDNKQLSLSRLNHRLPRSQAHSEVVQSTTEFHDEITDALFPQADAVFDDATTLDTAVDVLDP